MNSLASSEWQSFFKSTIPNHLNTSPEIIISKLRNYISDERNEKFERAITHRTRHFGVLLDDIYDQGNINAVLRTSENLGILEVHNIKSKKIKITPRIALGADKWLLINQYHNAEECAENLKSKGYQIVATDLAEDSKDLYSLNLDKKTVFVFGNEKDGVTKEMLTLADTKVKIPTFGLAQSLNISVAAGIVLGFVYHQVLYNKPQMYLNESEKLFLKALYYTRSVSEVDRLLSKLLME